MAITYLEVFLSGGQALQFFGEFECCEDLVFA